MADFDAPARYIRENYAREDRLAVVVIDRSSGRVDQKFAIAEQIATPRYQAHLRAANASGGDVYISQNTIKPEATGRTKRDIDEIRHIYLDLDVDGNAALERVLHDREVPNPHHILSTSLDKFQVIWSVEGFDKDEAERLLHGLAATHGADAAVTDCARVLRLPGFRNCKYAEPHYIRDIHMTPGERIYRPEDFPSYRIERSVPAPGPRRNFSGNGRISQSERDWAYAMRALDRGESPEGIEAKIEAFRRDKWNPRYYAQRTVARAVACRASRPQQQSPSGATRETDGPER